MAKTSGPQRTMIDRFRLFSLAEGINPTLLENYNGDWKVYADLQPSRFPFLSATTTNPLESSAPTTTPENAKLSPTLPNAPMKSRKSTRRLELRRRKLDYSEVDENSQDGGIVNTLTTKTTSSSAKHEGTKNR